MKKFILFFLFIYSFTFSAELKTDKNLITGQLKNGLKYYIYPNKKPVNSISAWLKVDAGSLYENPGEEGLAHFMEHLAFNGTEKYPENDLIRILESKGVDFGHGLNAHTGFDETVFKLNGQTKDLKDFLDILYQWGFKVKFTDTEVKKEKGVVIEEWRQETGLAKEISDFYNKYYFANSKYLDRLPIGKVPSIEKFTSASAKKFYKKWYVPNNMSIFIVGDISNPNEIIKSLENSFGKEKSIILPKTDALKNRKIIPIEKYDIFQNNDLKANNFTYLQVNPVVQPKNQMEKIKENQFKILFNVLLMQRYNEKLNSLDTNLNSIDLGKSDFNDYYDFTYLSLDLKNEKELNGITEGFKELSQVKLGFTPKEFEEARNIVKTYYKNLIEQSKSIDTGDILNSLLNNDFKKYLFIAPTDYYNTGISIIDSIKLEEVNNYSKSLFSGKENYYLFEGFKNINKTELQTTIEEAKKSTVSAYTRTENTGSIITKEIVPGTIVSENYDKDSDYYTLTLSNGSKVYAKKIDYEKNSVNFVAMSKGGTSYIKTEDISASKFLNVVAASAPGSMSKVDYDRYALSLVPFDLSFQVGSNSEYFVGSTSSANLNELIANFYAFVTEPKIDPKQLELSKNQTIEYLKNRNNSKDTPFWDEYNNEVTLGDPRDKILTISEAENVKAEDILRIYKNRFSNGVDYDYYIVGDFDYNKLKEAIPMYLASLNTGNKENFKVLDEKIRDKNVEVKKDLGLGEEASVIISFGKKTQLDKNYKYYNHMTSNILEIELIKILREKMSGVYSLNANIYTDKFYSDRASFDISFTCDPKRADELIAAAKVVIENIIKGQIDDKSIAFLKEKYLADYNRVLNKNSYYEAYFSNIMLDEPQDLTPEEFNKLVTKENISNFLKEIYGGYEAKYILNPAKK
ncbi:MAG: insulinase family protein [Fusobacteriaceae bacterium]|nr:insulinase family protein [Fusobacteriaceae bacterium]